MEKHADWINVTSKRRLLSVISLSFGPTLWRTLCKSLAGRTSSSTSQGVETRRNKLRRLIGSEWIQRAPEAWFVWFLLRGWNVDWSKSLLGMRYVRSSNPGCIGR